MCTNKVCENESERITVSHGSNFDCYNAVHYTQFIEYPASTLRLLKQGVGFNQELPTQGLMSDIK